MKIEHKRRCSISRCRKVAMDCIEGEYLCRVHSPMRRGYETKIKEEEKKAKEIKKGKKK